MEQLERAKEFYHKLIKDMRENSDLCVFDINSLDVRANLHLFGLELKEKWGLNIDPKKILSFDWVDLGEYVKIGNFGDAYERWISCSDTSEQPNNEMLLVLKFPTGPYMFGYGNVFNKDYPIDFFNQFYAELLTYNPDYTDSRNRNLYWKMENAKTIFNSFSDILDKYNQLNSEDIKNRKIKELKAELEKLEGK